MFLTFSVRIWLSAIISNLTWRTLFTFSASNGLWHGRRGARYIALQNLLDSFHLTADCVILLLKRNFFKENFLESKKIFISLLWKELRKTWFEANFKNFCDRIIHKNGSSIHQIITNNAEKHKARKESGISWNSNQRLPCENNCHLDIKQKWWSKKFLIIYSLSLIVPSFI